MITATTLVPQNSKKKIRKKKNTLMGQKIQNLSSAKQRQTVNPRDDVDRSLTVRLNFRNKALHTLLLTAQMHFDCEH